LDITLDELLGMQAKLEKEIGAWHEAKRPQTGYPDGPAYEALTQQYFKVSHMVKVAMGSAVPLGTRRRL
jgi:hypothetical protein